VNYSRVKFYSIYLCIIIVLNRTILKNILYKMKVLFYFDGTFAILLTITSHLHVY